LLRLFYYDGNRRTAEAHSQLFGANEGSGEARVNWRSLPPAPAGTDGVMAVVDPNGSIAEQNELNNSAVLQLPNFRPVKVDRDSKTGNLDIEVAMTRGAIPPGSAALLTIRSSTGKGAPQPDDVVVYRRTIVGALKVSVSPSDYAIPRGKHKNFIATVDVNNDVFETAENDNTLTHQIDLPDQWTLLSSGVNIDVYIRKTFNFKLSITRLQGAAMAHMVINNTNVGFKDHLARWNAFNRQNQQVHVVVNGTFFTNNGAPVTFDRGVKVNGQVQPFANKVDSETSLITFASASKGTAGFIPFQRIASMQSTSIPDMIGARDADQVEMGKPGNDDKRNWIGFRDRSGVGPEGEPRFTTVVTITADRKSERREVIKALEPWGVPQNQQFELDGGGSLGLAIKQKVVVSPTRGAVPLTTLPHTIAMIELLSPAQVGKASAVEQSQAAAKDSYQRHAAVPNPTEADNKLAAVDAAWFSTPEVLATRKQVFNSKVTLRLRNDASLVRLDGEGPEIWVREGVSPLKSVTSCHDEIYAIDFSGRLLRRTGDGMIIGYPAAEQHFVVDAVCEVNRTLVLTSSGRLFAVGEDGSGWEQQPDPPEHLTRLYGDDETVVAAQAGSGRLYWFDSTLSEWRNSQADVHSQIQTGIVLGNWIVLLDARGELTAISAAGAQRARLAAGCTSLAELGSAAYTVCSGMTYQVVVPGTGDVPVLEQPER
jgi:hypothetical protein